LDSTQQIQEINLHALSWIQTYNRSNQVAADHPFTVD